MEAEQAQARRSLEEEYGPEWRAQNHIQETLLRGEMWEVCMVCHKECASLTVVLEHIRSKKHQKKVGGWPLAALAGPAVPVVSRPLAAETLAAVPRVNDFVGAMPAWSKAPASGGKTGGTSSSSQPASGGGAPSWRVRWEAEQAQAAQSLEEEYSMIGSCGVELLRTAICDSDVWKYKSL